MWATFDYIQKREYTCAGLRHFDGLLKQGRCDEFI